MRERWGVRPVRVRWALGVYVVGFLVGTRTHVLDFGVFVVAFALPVSRAITRVRPPTTVSGGP